MAERRVSSSLLYAEARSALARAARARRISGARLREARHGVDALWEDVSPLEVTLTLARRAGELAEEHVLRAYDAVHLASAETIADHDTVLVAADGDLLAAARDRGISTASLGPAAG
jgi:predicted nucleic acid-binding protein